MSQEDLTQVAQITHESDYETDNDNDNQQSPEYSDDEVDCTPDTAPNGSSETKVRVPGRRLPKNGQKNKPERKGVVGKTVYKKYCNFHNLHLMGINANGCKHHAFLDGVSKETVDAVVQGLKGIPPQNLVAVAKILANVSQDVIDAVAHNQKYLHISKAMFDTLSKKPCKFSSGCKHQTDGGCVYQHAEDQSAKQIAEIEGSNLPQAAKDAAIAALRQANQAPRQGRTSPVKKPSAENAPRPAYDNRSKKPCKFGPKCNKGDACPYSH
jgi:hypothetical protein